MRISDLVVDRRENKWGDNERWVTDGATIWQVIKAEGFPTCWLVYIDGDVDRRSDLNTIIEMACWLADKRTHLLSE